MLLHRTAAALAAATLAVTTLGVAGGAHAAPGTTRIQPDRLDRGENPHVAYVLDGVLHNGEVRVDLGRGTRLLGSTAQGHVVEAPGPNQSRRGTKVVRIAADGTRTVLLRRVRNDGMVMSRDGSRLFAVRFLVGRGENMRTRLKVWNLSGSKLLTDRVVGGYATPMAATRNRVWMSDWDRGTYTLNAKGRQHTRVSRLVGSTVHLGAGLLAGYTKDPYDGGCTRIVRTARPRTVLWKSCDERVAAFNPAGTGFASFGILVDGIGPNLVNTRRLRGALTGRYRTNWFGSIDWENNRSVLLEANGARARALVRCTAGECENATDPTPATTP